VVWDNIGASRDSDPSRLSPLVVTGSRHPWGFLFSSLQHGAMNLAGRVRCNIPT
jgi:hypothetical protein